MEVPDPAACGAPTRDNFVLLPRVSAIQKTEDWQIEILKEEAKE